MIRSLTFAVIMIASSLIANGQTQEHIAISKTGPLAAKPGDLITYKISVGNTGQNAWSGTISDVLPEDFTYVSSSPEATTVSGRNLTWTLFPLAAYQSATITVTGRAGKLGSTFTTGTRYPDGYYMSVSNQNASLLNTVSTTGTVGPLTDNHTTVVRQVCDFSFNDVEGQIKQATSATTTYLVVIQNTGNVWDRFTLATDQNNNEFAECTNPDGSSSTRNEKLFNEILDMVGNPLTSTDWIAPGEPYTFYLRLQTPPGTSAGRWNCTRVTATSTVCGVPKSAWFHTYTVTPANGPLLNLYQVDYPDPVNCGETFKYTVYVSNMGKEAASNTVITDTYDSFVEFVSSSPAPDANTDNRWTLGPVNVNGYAKVDITVRVKPGVYNGQLLTNTVKVDYTDDRNNPFSTPAPGDPPNTVTTTVNVFPDLTLLKTSSSSNVKLGETITYTIAYSNIGCGPANNVTIVDDFDDVHTEVVNAGGGVQSLDGKLTWSLNNILSGGQGTITYSLRVKDVNCSARQIQNQALITSTETDKDILSNSSSVSVLAAIAPTWVDNTFPANVTVACNAIPLPPTTPPTALAACGATVTVTGPTDVITAGACPDRYTITRTWRATDSNGNFSDRSQIITVWDASPPTIIKPTFSGYTTGTGTLGNTIVYVEANQGANYHISNNDFDPSYTDDCGGPTTKSYKLDDAGPTGTTLNGVTLPAGLTVIRWTGTDRCGNSTAADPYLFTVVVNSNAGLSLEKTLLNINGNASRTTFDAVGNVINFNIRISNTGDVGLLGITLSDPLAVLDDAVPSTLAPGQSVDIRAHHVVTQADLDAARVLNTATVSGKTAGNVDVSFTNFRVVPAQQNPLLTVTKTYPTVPNSYDQVNDVLTFNITVKNDGNVTLTNIGVSDPGTVLSSVPSGPLAPGASITVTATYTATQHDLDAGKVENSATATGTYTDVNNYSHTVTGTGAVTVLADQKGLLSITKLPAAGTNYFDQAGDELRYNLVVSNTGNVTLYNLAVTDDIATVTGSPILELAPGSTISITASYNTTQADMDLGKVVNTASVAGVYYNSSGTPVAVSAQSQEITVQAIQSPTLSIAKSTTTTSYDQPGDIIDYSILVTNTGNVTLHNISVTDPIANAPITAIPELAPGASLTRTTAHTVTQADLDALQVINTATASTTFTDVNNAINNVSETATVTVPADPHPALSLVKTVTTNPATFDQVGDVLNYSIVITNTGNLTLTGLVVTDNMATLSGSTIASLAPGSSAVMTASRTIIQSDIDAGKVENTASVTGQAQGYPQPVVAGDIVTVIAAQDPSLSVDKSSTTNPNTYDEVGDVLTYSIVITNTGNATLTNLIVTDSPGTVTGSPVASLAPTQSVTLTASYTVTQQDLNAGRVNNTATVTGTYFDGVQNQTATASDAVTILATQRGLVTLDKASTNSPNSFDHVGQTLTYQLTVRNTGNVTLNNIVVADPMAAVTGSPIASLNPGLTATASATYVVTQADLDAGRVVNTASVTGSYRDAYNISRSAVGGDIETVNATQSASLTLVKSSTTSPNNFDLPGDVLTYNLVLTNTGNVTVTNLIVTDPLAAVLGNPVASLAPGASVTLTATHTVVQADLNAGKVDNTASVTGSYRDGANVQHQVSATSNTISIPGVQTGALTLAKTAAANSATYDQAGDVLTYNIVLRNTGNVTLSNLVVTDPSAVVTGSPVASLAPGATATVTAARTITQADLDAGKVDNTAGVTSTYMDASNTSHNVTASGSATVVATQNGALTLTKTSTTTPDSFATVGKVLTYNIRLTNTGNVTLSNLVITDPAATVTGSPVASLAPGASVTITANYTTVQADVDAGEFTNTATVTGNYTDHLNVGHQVQATGSATVTATQTPAITLTTSASQPTYDAVGDVITYTIGVVNAGNVTVTGVVVTDVLTGEHWNIATFAPGATASYTATYTVTQADLDAGSLVNTVNAAGTDPNTAPVTATASATITAVQDFTMTLTKKSDPVSYVSINGPVTYTITLENKGNVTLLNIKVTDVVPLHTTFVSADNGGTLNTVNGTVTWNVATLAPGVKLELQLKVLANADTEHGTHTINKAVAESSQIETINSNTVDLTILRYPVLRQVSVVNVDCFGNSTGRATVEVIGGMPPYTYTWNTTPAQTGPVATNLPVGTYKVRAEDSMGFSDELTITITQPLAALSATSAVTNVLCHDAATGAIALTVQGGTAPYTYRWNNNSVTRDLTNVPAGSYSVIITDANACTLAHSSAISQPAEAITISNTSIKEVKCLDDPFGSITYDISGGVPGYSFLWNTGATTQNLDNIGGGEYTLTVTDAIGCKLVQNFFVAYEYDECDIRVPSGLTPNSMFDSKLVIRGLERFPDNSFRIFNRYGTLVYEAIPYLNDWEGVPNQKGAPTEADGKVPAGTYFYLLDLTPGGKPLSGYIYLIKK